MKVDGPASDEIEVPVFRDVAGVVTANDEAVIRLRAGAEKAFLFAACADDLDGIAKYLADAAQALRIGVPLSTQRLN